MSLYSATDSVADAHRRKVMNAKGADSFLRHLKHAQGGCLVCRIGSLLAAILTGPDGPFPGELKLLPLLCNKTAMLKLQTLLTASGMRFNSQYPIILACVKAVCFVWAQAREAEPTATPPSSLFFLQAVRTHSFVQPLKFNTGAKRYTTRTKNRNYREPRRIARGTLQHARINTQCSN